MRIGLPQAIYDSAKRQAAPLRECYELIAYRDLLFLMVREHLKQRYQRSILGVFWAFLNPVLSMAVLAIAFSALFQNNISNYPVYVLIGVITWSCFAQTCSQIIDQVVGGLPLLRQMYLPRTIFSVAAVGTNSVNLVLSCIPLLVLMLATAHPISGGWLLLPVAILLLIGFALGVGLLIAAMALYFSDIGYLFQVVVQAWFFLTPVMYPIEIVPAVAQPWLQFNPMLVFVGLFRELLYTQQLPSLGIWGTALLISAISLIGGWIVFTYQSDQLTYRI
jgi:ABC-2 type transport system permease protein